MNLDIVNLILLQRLDKKIEQARTVAAEGPKKLAELIQTGEEADTKVRESLELEQELQKRRRELESEIADTDEKIKANQTRQLRVKNNEEYRAMLKEIEFLRKANSAREDETLEILDRLEKLTEDNKGLKVWLEEEQAALAKKLVEVEAWIAESAKSVEALDMERHNLTKDIPRNHMSLYNRVYNGRNRRAVVAILEGICQECHLQIPPQDFNELQRNEKVMTCPNCQRIMYWGEHQDFENL